MTLAAGLMPAQWVLVKGDPRHVSQYRSFDYDTRRALEPQCPVCGETVTLRLGNKLAHHYAHARGKRCASNDPLIATHLNARFHIANQLRKTDRLLLDERCASALCRHTQRIIWASDWDSVEVAHDVAAGKPDITLLWDGKPQRAIVFFVAEAVDDEHAASLDAFSGMWLEVRATDELATGPRAWKPAEPLPYLRLHPSFRWLCGDCRERAADRKRVEAVTQEAREIMLKKAQQPTPEPIPALMADQPRLPGLD